MQPLPSWLPTTQRHLGALTAELMQGDGGPVCFGNTVTLRGRGGRYVDFDFLALALTLTLTLALTLALILTLTLTLSLTVTLTLTRYVDVDSEGGAVAARWSEAGAWQVPPLIPALYTATPL